MQLEDHSRTASAHGCALANIYQRLHMLQSHILCVQDEIEEAQRAPQDKDLPSTADISEHETINDCQAWLWLQQHNGRVYHQEMTSQRKSNNWVQLQLWVDEVEKHKLADSDRDGDVECGRWQRDTQGLRYHGAVRLLPPILVVAFLTALATWFGSDLLRHQTEWQWGLQICHCITGWLWLKPVVQHAQEEQTQQQVWAQRASNHAMEDFHQGVLHDIVEPAAFDLDLTDSRPEEAEASTGIFDNSDLEDVKKHS